MPQLMVFEDLLDVLRYTVQRSGGAKAVGSILFPTKTPDQAGRYLLDCLNPDRAEKLGPLEVQRVISLGREFDCHEVMHFLARECGYSQPEPQAVPGDADGAYRDFVEAATLMRQALCKLDLAKAAKATKGGG